MTRKLELNQSTKYPFELDKVLYAGQDFRWCKWDDEWHSGVLDGNLIHIRQIDDVVEYKSDSGCDLNELLCRYFRLDVDIDEIYDCISDRDKRVKELVKKYPWLRVLRHPDPWECMVAYICAAPNSVKGITIIVEKIAEAIGQPIELCGDERYTFPTSEEVLSGGFLRLKGLDLGLKRAEYIIAAAKRISECKLDLAEFAKCNVPYDEAIWQLMEKHSSSRKAANGIGPKVADCIALFALNKSKAFPVDRNIGRALAELYDDCPPLPNNSKGGLSDKQYRDIANWARKRFGKYACYVNQLLFHKQRPQSNSRHRRCHK